MSQSGPSDETRLVHIVDAFAAAIREDRQPRLEHYLTQCPEVHRSELFLSLLLAEWQSILDAGRTPIVESCRQKYPQYSSEIDEVLNRLSWPPGSVLLDRYEIDKEIGRGGFGRVYRARDTHLDRLVAIKIPRIKDRAADVLAEAKAAGRLAHPGIVPIYTVETRSDAPACVVMQLVEGDTLAGILRRPGKIAFLEAAELLAQVCDAVHCAHTNGIVHRDLKPANILVKNGKTLVADFGLAVKETEPLQHGAGTPEYMAPEQFGDHPYASTRSDVWSLGVTIYEVLTGKRPFEGRGWNEVREQVVEADPKAPSTTDPTIPAALEDICLKCLKKRSEDRYATAARLAQDLREFIATHSRPGELLRRVAAFVIPCRYGIARVETTVRHLCQCDCFAGVPILVVDDSRDDDVWRELQPLSAEPRVKLLKNRWPDQHKMGAIRTGIEQIASDFVILLDDDTVLEEQGMPMHEVITRLQDGRGGGADACTFRVLPSSFSGLLGRCQMAEYAITTDSARELLGAVTCVTGAASVWRKASLQELLARWHSGVFEGDDLELTLLAYARDMRIIHEPSVLARTTVPTSLSELVRQRIRWDWGLLRMLVRPQLWRHIFLRATQAGALFRSLIIADVVLHPVKVLAFLYPLVLCFAVVGSSVPVISDEHGLVMLRLLVSAFLVCFGLGLLSVVWIRAPVPMRIRYVLAWSVYIGSPLLAFFLEVAILRFSHANLEPIVEEGSYLALSPWQEIVTSTHTPVLVLVANTFLWWLPVTWFLLRRSRCEEAQRPGMHMLLLPLYLMFLLFVVRTVSLLGFICFGWAGYRRVRVALQCFALVFCISGCVLLLFGTYKIIADAPSSDSPSPRQWIISNIVPAKGRDNHAMLLVSYRGLEGRSWAYDTSLAIIALAADGEDRYAKGLLDGLRELQDPRDGAWYRSYGVPGVIDDLELDTNSIAWSCIAAYYYQLQTDDKSFRPMASDALKWLAEHAVKVKIRGKWCMGMPDFSTTDYRPPLPAQGEELNEEQISTKATIATLVACRYANATGEDGIARELSSRLRPFLEEAAWDEDMGRFLKESPPREVLMFDTPIDTQTWAVLALGPQATNRERYRKSLKWCEERFLTTVSGRIAGGGEVWITGLAYSDVFNGSIYAEGTLQTAAAYHAIGEMEQAEKWMAKCRRFRSRDGGVFCALGAVHCDLPRRPAASATCWAWFNEMMPPLNPFQPVKRRVSHLRR